MNILIYKSFGKQLSALKDAVHQIESVLEITFIERESSFSGICYTATYKNCKISISNNYNEIESIWDFKNYKNLNIIVSLTLDFGKKNDRLRVSSDLTELFVGLDFKLISTTEININ